MIAVADLLVCVHVEERRHRSSDDEGVILLAAVHTRQNAPAVALSSSWQKGPSAGPVGACSRSLSRRHDTLPWEYFQSGHGVCCCVDSARKEWFIDDQTCPVHTADWISCWKSIPRIRYSSSILLL